MTKALNILRPHSIPRPLREGLGAGLRGLGAGLLFLLSLSAKSQEVCQPADSARVVEILEQAPADAGVTYFARQFIGVPYVGHTLEKSLDDEPLVINLRELDCTTYVETVAALWQANRDKRHATYDSYKRWLARYRYWNGQRDDYLSRHHYFSWWWHDNVRQGILSEVDLSASGAELTPMVVKLNYMSLHPELYQQLNAHREWLPRLQKMEQEYSGHDGLFLSKQELLRKGSKAFRGIIKDGDVIAIVTTKGGLDYSHLGFASWQGDGRLHLLNASSIHHKVVDEPKTLYKYLSEHKTSVGIRVFRLK